MSMRDRQSLWRLAEFCVRAVILSCNDRGVDLGERRLRRQERLFVDTDGSMLAASSTDRELHSAHGPRITAI